MNIASPDPWCRQNERSSTRSRGRRSNAFLVSSSTPADWSSVSAAEIAFFNRIGYFFGCADTFSQVFPHQAKGSVRDAIFSHWRTILVMIKPAPVLVIHSTHVSYPIRLGYDCFITGTNNFYVFFP
jgi:hypothetical protein